MEILVLKTPNPSPPQARPKWLQKQPTSAMSQALSLQFEAPIEEFDFGRFAYHVIYLPAELVEQEPFCSQARIRLRGDIGSLEYAGAVHNGRGLKYLILSKAFLKEAGLKPGDLTQVKLSIDDPDRVDVPEILRVLLDENPKAQSLWEELSPGKKRGLCHPIAKAKREETIRKRAQSLIKQLESDFDEFS